MRVAWIPLTLTLFAGACERTPDRPANSTPGPATGTPPAASMGGLKSTSKMHSPYDVEITRFTDPSHQGAIKLSDQTADNILKGFMDTLGTDDGNAANGDGDVSCSIAVQRKGSVKTYSVTDAPGIIVTEKDYLQVCKQPGYIHLVDQLGWCGAESDHLVGCAYPGGMMCIVVVRYFADDVLWAHEFGHTRGLPHPCGDPGKRPCDAMDEDRVMHPEIDSPHRKIGTTECAAYK